MASDSAISSRNSSPLLGRQHFHIVGLVLDEGGERDRRGIERQRSGLHARVVENLLDGLQQAAPGAPERLEVGVLGVIADIGQVLADEIGVSQDDVERRANLMAGVGEESGFKPRRLERGVARAGQLEVGGAPLADVAQDRNHADTDAQIDHHRGQQRGHGPAFAGAQVGLEVAHRPALEDLALETTIVCGFTKSASSCGSLTSACSRL